MSNEPLSVKPRPWWRRPERLGQVALGLSLALWLGLTLFRAPCHTFADLECGHYTDHLSDMNITRALATEGTVVWTRPLDELGRPLSNEQAEALPRDVAPYSGSARSLRGWPDDKPFLSSFDQLPSLSPPGGLLLTAPVAAAYHFTNLSFTDANQLLIASSLVFAHISLWIVLRTVIWRGPSTMGYLGWFILYGETIHMTLFGFSEAAVIGPLVLCGWALARRNGLAAAAWFAVAASLHFRALYFLPLLVFALFLIARDRAWKSWTAPQWLIAALTVVIGALTAITFFVVMPAFQDIRLTNDFHYENLLEHKDVAVMFALTVIVLAGSFAFASSWTDVALIVWVAIMTLFVRESYPWNVLTLLAWLALPIAARAKERMVRDIRVAALLVIAMGLFNHGSFGAPEWIAKVF